MQFKLLMMQQQVCYWKVWMTSFICRTVC